jgi:hypothetical protein
MHNGSQTAIVVAMKLQPKNTEQTLCTITEGNGSESGKHFWCNVVDFSCTNQPETLNAPYALGQEVYVRETWNNGYSTITGESEGYFYKINPVHRYKNSVWHSPITMPKSAARTRFKIVGCEAVRVYYVSFDSIRSILGYDENYKNTTNLTGYFRHHIITRFGQSAWDNNDYIWYYKIEKI